MKNVISAVCVAALFVGGCATNSPAQRDYTAYRAANVKSILVLPPRNRTPDVGATNSFYSVTQKPIAESGYYVLPITLVDEQFKNNGLTIADEIHEVDVRKLREVFGADAALYISISDFGTRYQIIDSVSTVTADAYLVDLKTGERLWSGTARASSSEQDGNRSSGSLIGILVSAALNQIVGTLSDRSHDIAKITSERLLSAHEGRGGLLYGPRSPEAQQAPMQPQPKAPAPQP